MTMSVRYVAPAQMIPKKSPIITTAEIPRTIVFRNLDSCS
jgi:hypothetical protein